VDNDLRKLERAYAATGSEPDAEALLTARIRIGEPSPRLILEMLARLVVAGTPTSKELLMLLDGDLRFSSVHDLNDQISDVDFRLGNLENQL
jgi:hypothetical protein